MLVKVNNSYNQFLVYQLQLLLIVHDIYNYLKTFGDISKENNWQSGNGKLTLEKVNKIRDDILEHGSLPKALITGVNSAYKIELSAKGKTSTTGSKTKVKKTARKSIK